MDAFVLVFWENKRNEDKQSKQWADRQNRKVDGAMKAMNQLAKERKQSQGGSTSEYLLGDVLTIADIAVVCAVGMVEFAGLRPQWKEKLPDLASYVANLEARKTFEETRPVMFDLKDGLV
jgi:glutathione S-transferase